MGGDMTGQRPSEGDYEKLGGEDCIFLLLDIFLVLGSLVLEFW
jgi:hypothetical protein